MKTLSIIKSVISTEIVLSFFLLLLFVVVAVSFFIAPYCYINVVLGFFFLLVASIIGLITCDLIRDNYRDSLN